MIKSASPFVAAVVAALLVPITAVAPDAAHRDRASGLG